MAVFSLVLIAGCAAQPQDNASVANEAPTMAASPVPKGMRGPEPATSPAAIEAKALVENYYALIKAKKYAAARKSWGHDGADSGGDTKAFTATITPYSVYQPKVGGPTEIQVADGMQYVNIAATLHVQRRDTKAEADRDGVVMLYRSINPNDAVVEKRNWKIRGIDIRLHH